MGIWDWIDTKSITDKLRLEKTLKIAIRILYFTTLISAVLRTFLIPKDYYKIVYDFATHNTASWGSAFEITFWSSVISAFTLFIIFRLYIRYKQIELINTNSVEFYLWLLGMTFITIDGILYVPIIKGLAFWLLYSLFHLGFGTTKDFFTTLNGSLFSWFNIIVVGVFALYSEKILPDSRIH